MIGGYFVGSLIASILIRFHLLGDAPPHTKAESPYGIDWKEEARLLVEEHIRVYAVKVFSLFLFLLWR